jgi:hypothetical protein
VDGKDVEMYRDQPDDSKRLLRFKTEDARAWTRGGDGEVCIFARYNWWNNIVRIASVDRDNRGITLASDCSYAIRPGDRYYVQGLFEELDAPGEWYLDQAAGKLYFWPPVPLEGKAVIAPTLRTIIEIGQGASHVTIQGFAIECCEGTAVTLTSAEDCLVAGCAIRNVGDYSGSGVQISGGLRNGVAGCDVSEVGRDGIAIGGGDRKTLVPAGNYADNNYIHHVGVFYKQGVGIKLEGVGNRASHNLIHDGPRMGIIFSGNPDVRRDSSSTITSGTSTWRRKTRASCTRAGGTGSPRAAPSSATTISMTAWASAGRPAGGSAPTLPGACTWTTTAAGST